MSSIVYYLIKVAEQKNRSSLEISALISFDSGSSIDTHTDNLIVFQLSKCFVIHTSFCLVVNLVTLFQPFFGKVGFFFVRISYQFMMHLLQKKVKFTHFSSSVCSWKIINLREGDLLSLKLIRYTKEKSMNISNIFEKKKKVDS